MVQDLLGKERKYLRTFKWAGFAGRSTVLAVTAAFVFAGCIRMPLSGPQKWPAGGIGEFCAGDEPLSAAREAAGKASRLKREVGNRHAPDKRRKIRELRDTAQCIFAAHAERGDTEGRYLFAITLLSSNPRSSTAFRRPPNAKQVALRQLRQAGLQGHGRAFITALKVLPSKTKGQWIREAAKAGNVEAQYELGVAHLKGGPFGYGIRRDAKEAERWLTMAAERGSGHAAAALGSLYGTGAPGVARDKRRAIRLLEPLLENPPKARHGGGPFHTVHPTQLARLYCAVSQKDKALVMYQRAHNVGESKAREIMKRKCPQKFRPRSFVDSTSAPAGLRARRRGNWLGSRHDRQYQSG